MLVRKKNESRDARRQRLIREAEVDIEKGLQETDLGGMKVYVQGLIYLDCSLALDVSLKEFCDSLAQGSEKVRKDWSSDGAEAGGFPSHGIRSAAKKGAKVFFGGHLPKRLPKPIDRFLQEHNVDTRYARRYDGPVAKSLKLRFADGKHCLVVDKGTTSYVVPLPEEPFDVLLVNPGALEERRPLLKQLRERMSYRHGHTQVGLIARGDWDQKDWRLLKDSEYRVYLNQKELTETVKKQFPGASRTDPQLNLPLLRRTVGSSLTVTTTLGKNGVIYMNHVPFIRRLSGVNLPVVRSGGAGDTLATTATLSAAAGAPDAVCARRGNMDAALYVSGNSVATSFIELDAEIEKHPEMREISVLI